MTNQKTPHTQTQQNTSPEQTDAEQNEIRPAEAIYQNAEGAESGANRSPRTLHTGGPQHNTEPEQEAHEGPISSRLSRKPVQGITTHSAEEESARQQKVVNNRPDAQAGVKHSER
ncbi:MAG TPA: hypothetical protein VFA90_15920 [Terriglobales bacterium]|nr:hypothetical protein [Terriglobales bacterium]